MISLDSLSLATTKNLQNPLSITNSETIEELLPEKVIIVLPTALTEMTTNKCSQQQQQQQRQKQQPEGQQLKQCQQQKSHHLVVVVETDTVVNGRIVESPPIVADDGNEDMIENLNNGNSNNKNNSNNKRIPATITIADTNTRDHHKGKTMAKQEQQQQHEPELSFEYYSKTAMAKCSCGNNNKNYTNTSFTTDDINNCNCISQQNNGNINTTALNSVNNCVNNSCNNTNNNNKGNDNSVNNVKQEQQQLNLAQTNKPNNVGFNEMVVKPPPHPPPMPPPPPSIPVSHDTTNKSHCNHHHHQQHHQSWPNAGINTDRGILSGRGGGCVVEADSKGMPQEQALKLSTVVAALKSIGHNYGDNKANNHANTDSARHSYGNIWDSNSFAGGYDDNYSRDGGAHCHPTNANNENDKHSTIQWNTNNNNNNESSSATVQCVLSTCDDNENISPQLYIDANAAVVGSVGNVSMPSTNAATAAFPTPTPVKTTTVIPPSTSFVMAELSSSVLLPQNICDNDNNISQTPKHQKNHHQQQLFEDPFGNAAENASPLATEICNGPSDSDSVNLMDFTEIINEPSTKGSSPLMDSSRWETSNKDVNGPVVDDFSIFSQGLDKKTTNNFIEDMSGIANDFNVAVDDVEDNLLKPINLNCNFMPTNNLESVTTIFCDLNETLEEQNLLESKEILVAETTDEEIKAECEINARQQQQQQLVNKMLMAEKASEMRVVKLEKSETEKVNETKTPVTCINVHLNSHRRQTDVKVEESDSKTDVNRGSAVDANSAHHMGADGGELWSMTAESCAELPPPLSLKESCQNITTISSRRQVTKSEPPVDVVNDGKIKILPTSCCVARQERQENYTSERNVINGENSPQQNFSISQPESCERENPNENLQHLLQHHCQQSASGAYTLREFAKCLKPSADEDDKIIVDTYTIAAAADSVKTLKQNENLQNLLKEKRRKLCEKLNKEKELTEIIVKNQVIPVDSGKSVNGKGLENTSASKVLCNDILKNSRGIVSQNCEENYFEVEEKSVSSSERLQNENFENLFKEKDSSENCIVLALRRQTCEEEKKQKIVDNKELLLTTTTAISSVLPPPPLRQGTAKRDTQFSGPGICENLENFKLLENLENPRISKSCEIFGVTKDCNVEEKIYTNKNCLTTNYLAQQTLALPTPPSILTSSSPAPGPTKLEELCVENNVWWTTKNEGQQQVTTKRQGNNNDYHHDKANVNGNEENDNNQRQSDKTKRYLNPTTTKTEYIFKTNNNKSPHLANLNEDLNNEVFGRWNQTYGHIFVKTPQEVKANHNNNPHQREAELHRKEPEGGNHKVNTHIQNNNNEGDDGLTRCVFLDTNWPQIYLREFQEPKDEQNKETNENIHKTDEVIPKNQGFISENQFTTHCEIVEKAQDTAKGESAFTKVINLGKNHKSHEKIPENCEAVPKNCEILTAEQIRSRNTLKDLPDQELLKKNPSEKNYEFFHKINDQIPRNLESPEERNQPKSNGSLKRDQNSSYIFLKDYQDIGFQKENSSDEIYEIVHKTNEQIPRNFESTEERNQLKSNSSLKKEQSVSNNRIGACQDIGFLKENPSDNIYEIVHKTNEQIYRCSESPKEKNCLEGTTKIYGDLKENRSSSESFIKDFQDNKENQSGKIYEIVHKTNEQIPRNLHSPEEGKSVENKPRSNGSLKQDQGSSDISIKDYQDNGFLQENPSNKINEILHKTNEQNHRNIISPKEENYSENKPKINNYYKEDQNSNGFLKEKQSNKIYESVHKINEQILKRSQTLKEENFLESETNLENVPKVITPKKFVTQNCEVVNLGIVHEKYELIPKNCDKVFEENNHSATSFQSEKNNNFGEITCENFHKINEKIPQNYEFLNKEGISSENQQKPKDVKQFLNNSKCEEEIPKNFENLLKSNENLYESDTLENFEKYLENLRLKCNLNESVNKPETSKDDTNEKGGREKTTIQNTENNNKRGREEGAKTKQQEINPKVTAKTSVKNHKEGEKDITKEKNHGEIEKKNPRTINSGLSTTQKFHSNEEPSNLEEFEASQRLKRLLNTIPPLKYQSLTAYKQNNPTTPPTTLRETETKIKLEEEELKALNFANKQQKPYKVETHKSNNNKENTVNKREEGQQQQYFLRVKDNSFVSQSKQGVVVLNTKATTKATTTTPSTSKANKLQADCKTTLERSSITKQPNIEYGIPIHKGNARQISDTTHHQANNTIGSIRPTSSTSGNDEQQQENTENSIENDETDNKEEQQTRSEEKELGKITKQFIETKLRQEQYQKSDILLSRQTTNSPQAYVTAKVVRLRHQQQLQQQQEKLNIDKHLTFEQQKQQPEQQLSHTDFEKAVTLPATETISPANQHFSQQQCHQQHQRPDNENANIPSFPLAKVDLNANTQEGASNCKVSLESPTKRCNLNLQHIVNTKELVKRQQQTTAIRDKTQGEPTATTATSSATTTTSEYKSAFVPTKPEIEPRLIPRNGNSATTAEASLKNNHLVLVHSSSQADLVTGPAEFDTQRFSEFLQKHYQVVEQRGGEQEKNNNNSTPRTVAADDNNHSCNVASSSGNREHVLTEYFRPLIYQCYDELLLEQETTKAFNSNFIQKQQPIVADPQQEEPYNTIHEDDDAESISSTTSSPCGCLNCQLEEAANIQEQQQQIILQQENQSTTSSPPPPPLPARAAVVVVARRSLPKTTINTNNSNKMREVNGQLRGLLKKPNRPPPARKNRVVFDETRNEFFEADYIILIREDCAYDEEDEEPCTCGEHELVRLCCEEGCQCNYSTTAPATATDDSNRTPQSPKFAPPIEFVDEAALSPPDGYKDNGLKNTLGGALSGHIFGAQHLQQLQVIQRLQQQRAAMLAARNNSQIPPPPPPVNQQQHPSSPASAAATAAASAATSNTSAPTSGSAGNNNSSSTATTTIQLQHSPDDDPQGVCTECAECAECAAKQLQQDTECHSPQCQEDLTTAPLGVPAVAILPLHTSSPERRITQKEIIAGEERPRYVLQAQYKSSPVTERRIVREASEDLAIPTSATAAGLDDDDDEDLVPPALPAKPATMQSGGGISGSGISNDNNTDNNEKPPPIPPKESSPTTQISGILKGGKLWKQDSISQSDDQNNTTSEDEAGSMSNHSTKRSVRFVTEDLNNSCDEIDGASSSVDDVNDNQINELIPIKKHSTLFKNALRPNSAVQQLFPSSVVHQTLTSEALRAFDESKRAGSLVSTLPGAAGAGDSDTLRRSMERNILRRSLIKKKAVKSDISLEDRIRQLTCGIDEDNDESNAGDGDDDLSKSEDGTDFSHRDSPAGEENPQKFTGNGGANNSDKSFSPNSSVSSSSSGSSAYKKITEIFNRDKKSQEKIMEMEENPIVIIPQECRCPAAPDLGMGVQVPVVHTQIHRTPPRQTEPKRQFLSTLAPLTACVAGNKDDLSSYYTLAAAHHNQAAHHIHASEYSLSALVAGDPNVTGMGQGVGDEVRKVAPDVIAGTPGQEQQDELAAFVQQDANRTEKIKKRYGNESSGSEDSKDKKKDKEKDKDKDKDKDNSDDDEGNDYGFNKRPSVRGIKPKFSSTNEILQQMQEQLTQQMPSVAQSQALPQPMKSYTLPKQSSTSAMSKQISQQPSPQNVPHPTMVASSQTQLSQPQQLCSAVVGGAVGAGGPSAIQLPANATIAQAQQTEQRTWSFYSAETAAGAGGEQQRLPIETAAAAAAMQQTYYQTLPTGAMFRHTMIHQQQGPAAEEAMLYAQNCQAMATTIEPQPQPHYGHYARSPTRRPESPPPLRNYHQTMVLIPYNAETYSQFAATNIDPKMAHMQRQNILEYQQVTQQTIRVPIGYALPGMQLHVVAGRGQHTTAQYATAPVQGQHRHHHQILTQQRYQFAQDASSMAGGFSERGVPEGAAAVSHSDCSSSGMVSPTTAQQMSSMQQGQQQQNSQMQQQQQQMSCQQQQQMQQQQQQQQLQMQQQQQQQQQSQIQNNVQTATAAAAAAATAQGSVYYAMNV
ncbi:uncharacterized protein isoform X4 [Musca autumnalis]|uniref:uncharacterized protein isoform X4 n=1 Tax=Musca autumnalis TaxID=221902 RepID=UPI003CF52C78